MNDAFVINIIGGPLNNNIAEVRFCGRKLIPRSNILVIVKKFGESPDSAQGILERFIDKIRCVRSIDKTELEIAWKVANPSADNFAVLFCLCDGVELRWESVGGLEGFDFFCNERALLDGIAELVLAKKVLSQKEWAALKHCTCEMAILLPKRSIDKSLLDNLRVQTGEVTLLEEYSERARHDEQGECREEGCGVVCRRDGGGVSGRRKSIPPPMPLAEVVETVAQHQAAGFSPSTVAGV